MDDPNTIHEFRTIAGGIVVGLALLIAPLIVHFRFQEHSTFSQLKRFTLLSLSALGMLLLVSSIVRALIPDFWSDTDRFDSNRPVSPTDEQNNPR